MNELHEWYLSVVYAHVTYSYKEFLEKETSVSINHRNLQLLTATMFKLSEGKYPKNESKVFPENQR